MSTRIEGDRVIYLDEGGNPVAWTKWKIVGSKKQFQTWPDGRVHAYPGYRVHRRGCTLSYRKLDGDAS